MINTADVTFNVEHDYAYDRVVVTARIGDIWLERALTRYEYDPKTLAHAKQCLIFELDHHVHTAAHMALMSPVASRPRPAKTPNYVLLVCGV